LFRDDCFFLLYTPDFSLPPRPCFRVTTLDRSVILPALFLGWINLSMCIAASPEGSSAAFSTSRSQRRSHGFFQSYPSWVMIVHVPRPCFSVTDSYSPFDATFNKKPPPAPPLPPFPLTPARSSLPRIFIPQPTAIA